MRTKTKAPAGIAMAVLLLGMAPPARAEEQAFADRPGVAPEVLGTMRGGFTTSVGGAPLELSFGIERVVTINGDVVGSTSFRIPSLEHLDALRVVSRLQSGPGNSIAHDLAPTTTLHVIQNTLDNQVLRQVTTIDASVRNLDLHRAVQLGAVLNRQLIMSVR